MVRRPESASQHGTNATTRGLHGVHEGLVIEVEIPLLFYKVSKEVCETLDEVINTTLLPALTNRVFSSQREVCSLYQLVLEEWRFLW